MTFTKKLIDVTFVMGDRNGKPARFAGSDGNTLKLSGLRVSARIVKAGGASKGTAQLSIYGMTMSQMNQLSTLGQRITLVRRDSVIIEAGDDESGMFKVFQGTITNAYADMQGAPDVAFRVDAHVGLAEDVQNAQPSSYRGSVDVATVMQQLALQMGYVFENSGVQVQLSSPYYSGSLRQQAQKAADEANINWIMDNGVLAIWPKNGARKAKAVVLSPETGMVGYPAYTAQGVQITALFQANVQFGGQVQVKSSLEPANGTWTVLTIDHDIESKQPNGRWFSTFGCYNPSLVTVTR